MIAALKYRWLEHRRKQAYTKLIQPHLNAGTSRKSNAEASTPELLAALASYLQQPLPNSKTPLADGKFLAVDIETNGLNPAQDDILSIGFVAIDGLAIQLETARHILVKPRGQISESSAVVHNIFDDEARTGASLSQALAPLLTALAGRVMIAHYASIERRFLDRACKACFRLPLLSQITDTLELEKRVLLRSQGAISQDHLQADALRLANVRERYNLPAAPSHNALSDALATAELFLALVSEHPKKSLGQVLT